MLQAHIIGSYGETITRTIQTGPVLDIAVNPTTNLIYIASGRTAVDVLNGTSKSLIASIETGSVDAPAVGVAVDPNTNLIYVTNRGMNSLSRYAQDDGDIGKVSVINGTTNKVYHTVPVENAPLGIAVNPATNLVYVANGGYNSVTVINGSQHFSSYPIKIIVNSEHVAVNPITNIIYISTAGNTVLYAVNGTNRALESNITLPAAATDIEVNPSTNKIYVATQAGTVAVYDGNTMKMIAYLWTGFSPFGIAVNPNTNRVYVTDSYSQRLSVIDGGPSNRVINEINITNNGATGIGVNPKTNEVYLGTCSCAASAPNLTYAISASHQELQTTNIANMSHLFVISDTGYQTNSVLSRNGTLVISSSFEPFLIRNNETYFVTPLDSDGKFVRLFFMNWSDSDFTNNGKGADTNNSNNKVMRQISISKDAWLHANYKVVPGPFFGCNSCGFGQEPPKFAITINAKDASGSAIQGIKASLYSARNDTIIATRPTPASFEIVPGERYNIKLEPTSSGGNCNNLHFDHWKDIDAHGPQLDLIINSTRSNPINATLNAVYMPSSSWR